MKELIPTERIERFIFLIRGQKILLDADLALIYGVPTKVLNQGVKRNMRRFPSDFVFRLTAEELEAIQSQIATGTNRSQIVTGSQKHRDPLPVLTEELIRGTLSVLLTVLWGLVYGAY